MRTERAMMRPAVTLSRAALRAVGAAFAGATLCAGAASAPESPGAPVRLGNVEIAYRDPAQFTEIRRYPGERSDWLDELSAYTARRAARVLPAGERLSVTITDVQRAGMFEPWRRGNLSNVRIVRDTTPPRINLSFRLESAQGQTLKQGERQLHDIAFLTRSARHRGESLGFEKNLIDDWLARELRAAP